MSRVAASPLTDEQKAKTPLITYSAGASASGHRAQGAVRGIGQLVRHRRDAGGRSVALLDELAAHATQPKYVISYPYRVGDVVIWDNASLLHSATLTDPDDPRTLWRITIKEPSAKLDAVDVLAPTLARTM